MKSSSFIILLTSLCLILCCKIDKHEDDEAKRTEAKTELLQQKKEEGFNKFKKGPKPIRRGEINEDGKRVYNQQRKIEWLDMSKLEKKKGTKMNLVYIYADWQKDCKKMEETTFADPKLNSYINKNFYTGRFNGEEKTPIKFKRKTYKFLKSGRGANLLTLLLMGGKTEYPAIVIMNNKLKKVEILKGYRSKNQLFEDLKRIVAKNK